MRRSNKPGLSEVSRAEKTECPFSGETSPLRSTSSRRRNYRIVKDLAEPLRATATETLSVDASGPRDSCSASLLAG